MSKSEDAKQARKEALRQLRETRKEIIERATLRMKEHRKAIEALKRQLASGAQTVPELAETTGISTSSTMWYIATLKKYGEISEGTKDGSFFRYELAGAALESAPESGKEG